MQIIKNFDMALSLKYREVDQVLQKVLHGTEVHEERWVKDMLDAISTFVIMFRNVSCCECFLLLLKSTHQVASLRDRRWQRAWFCSWSDVRQRDFWQEDEARGREDDQTDYKSFQVQANFNLSSNSLSLFYQKWFCGSRLDGQYNFHFHKSTFTFQKWSWGSWLDGQCNPKESRRKGKSCCHMIVILHLEPQHPLRTISTKETFFICNVFFSGR